MTLRPYQQEGCNAAVEWMRKSVAPFCIEAATGAGKSHMIASVAASIHQMTGKRILCLAPSAELVTQNREKYLASGNRASLFSASAGAKDLRHPVVFGSPLTVKNRISAFQRQGNDGYAMVVVDECHGITPTLISIIDAMREANENLRVCGFTATPYRLGTGWVFREHSNGAMNGDDVARDPYFAKCVYQIRAPYLIEQGFLTPPIIGQINAEGYDTSGLTANRMGKFDDAAVDRAYHGHGRKTSGIVADIVAHAQNRHGVMIFAATVQHAQEVLASLPPELSALITGTTPKGERDATIKAFKSRRIKYLVNVSVLTTGFDAEHVDLVAILRKTESVGLLQQIIGRGLRLSPGKTDCLVLDYTTNLDDHCPDGDLFAPVIEAKAASDGGKGLGCICPECSHENMFTAHKDYLDSPKDGAGYVLDLDGNRIESEYGPIPGHYGRRCMGYVQSGRRGEYERCRYRWTFKECPHCEADNDIAARYCCECKGEIVDPNDKLRSDFKALKRDPTKLQTDAVVMMQCKPGVSRNGNKTIRVEWVTPFRQFTTWVSPDADHWKARASYDVWAKATDNGETAPRSVTYQKNADTGFFDIKAYNKEPDHAPE